MSYVAIIWACGVCGVNNEEFRTVCSVCRAKRRRSPIKRFIPIQSEIAVQTKRMSHFEGGQASSSVWDLPPPPCESKPRLTKEQKNIRRKYPPPFPKDRDKPTETWLEREFSRFRCPKCKGSIFNRDAIACSHCGIALRQDFAGATSAVQHKAGRVSTSSSCKQPKMGAYEPLRTSSESANESNSANDKSLPRNAGEAEQAPATESELISTAATAADQEAVRQRWSDIIGCHFSHLNAWCLGGPPCKLSCDSCGALYDEFTLKVPPEKRVIRLIARFLLGDKGARKVPQLLCSVDFCQHDLLASTEIIHNIKDILDNLLLPPATAPQGNSEFPSQGQSYLCVENSATDEEDMAASTELVPIATAEPPANTLEDAGSNQQRSGTLISVSTPSSAREPDSASGRNIAPHHQETSGYSQLVSRNLLDDEYNPENSGAKISESNYQKATQEPRQIPKDLGRGIMSSESEEDKPVPNFQWEGDDNSIAVDYCSVASEDSSKSRLHEVHQAGTTHRPPKNESRPNSVAQASRRQTTEKPSRVPTEDSSHGIQDDNSRAKRGLNEKDAKRISIDNQRIRSLSSLSSTGTPPGFAQKLTAERVAEFLLRTRVIALMGCRFVGKSTMARLLNQYLEFAVCDDSARKDVKAALRTYKRNSTDYTKIPRLVIDRPNITRRERYEWWQLCKEYGVPSYRVGLLYLFPGAEICCRRCMKRMKYTMEEAEDEIASCTRQVEPVRVGKELASEQFLVVDTQASIIFVEGIVKQLRSVVQLSRA
eukprot:Gregarina_sp_Poly_1__7388@NODE_408_length_8806_cov_149_317199_g332_i0_p1_GENE_NODE_408_length_8806_cov_149_317199_g332_i0NODE_408_length_8806_cov_149_317199_g332_i0_p1_ORF_typecomplete_len768_score80_47AAA_33/PF13671_6/1_3e09KTI12/PF08433_10/1_9e03KTI12/PF08433_10/1_4e05zfRanBP/PF00641_18/0_00014zfRanBP/PF00641_18/2_4e03zfRanBP/PF00641_18/1_8e04zfRanBP/PF00641_18/1_5e03tRNA_lig_kinase/PF08303_11/0_0005AAA_28/PF13521_6/0_013CPT/PF07931_12/0_049CoaE/PF01121_20/1_1CoaE/PF01121_20/2_9e02Zf_RING/PF16